MDEQTVNAVANHGRWVCECPMCGFALKVKDFNAVQILNRFGCLDCGWGLPDDIYKQILKLPQDKRIALGSKIIELSGVKIIYPDCGAIEEILSARKMINRNWSLGETLDKLIDENIEHGVAERRVR